MPVTRSPLKTTCISVAGDSIDAHAGAQIMSTPLSQPIVELVFPRIQNTRKCQATAYR